MLPSLTLAFTLGLALGSLIPYFPLSLSIGLLIVVVAFTVLEARQLVTFRQATAGLSFLLIGILYWTAAVERSSWVPSKNGAEGLLRALTGRIIAPVQQAPDRLVMIVRRESEESDSLVPRVIRLTWRQPERLHFHGDRIRFSAKLRAPSGTMNPGGFDYAAYLERQGIDAVATVTGVDGVEFLESGRTSATWGSWNQIDQWRGSIRLAAVQALSQPALGLFLGIIVGDRGYLDAELRDQFMVTGTVHLLSISGSHLGLVALLTFAMVQRAVLLLPHAWLLGLSRSATATRIAAVATVFPVTAYACVAGAEVATVRSLIMLWMTLLARWLGYEQRMFHALALAATVILLHDPQALYDISFQLSFLSVCTIAAWLSWSASNEQEEASVRVASLWATGVYWAKHGFGMSALVTVVTIPFVAYYFNQIPWLGLFTNILAVPIMGFVLVPIGLLAGLWQIVVGGDRLTLAPLLQPVSEWFIEGVNTIANVPIAEWHVASPSVPAMVVFYICLGVIWWKPRGGLPRWVASIGIGVLLLWWVWSPRLFLDGDSFRVTFLDVGQGDSAVIEAPDGEVILIDGGAAYERFDMGRGVVAPYLWDRGIRTIDHMVGTHPQLDHVGGLAWLLRHFAVKHYWGSGDQRNEPFYRKIQQALLMRGLLEQVPHAGQDILLSRSCRLLVLNPSEDVALSELQEAKSREGRLLNNRSVVTELECGSHRMLFAADIEQDGIRRMQSRLFQAPLEILKVPHHGAVSSLNREWLAELRPQHAVFSVGAHNPFGHPAPVVLDAYASQKTLMYRTDRDGGVWITGRTSDPGLHIHRTREESLRPTTPLSCLWSCEKANWERLFSRWGNK